ncbi:S8 family serine peptidase [Nonomuraea maritima]|uniref:S8 family serine peptidase n=1 Tax=Nonomuraea maritima TaxID=683260 RepID=UPI00371319A4
MRLSLARLPAASAAAALLAVVATPLAAHSAPVDQPSTSATGGAPTTVTLITGDKVTLTPQPNGHPSVSVERAPGAKGPVRIATEGGDTYVYPAEAIAYIAAGRLDKQLFDVTQLIAQGYDDAHSADLPLIVTKGAATAEARTTAPPSSTTLPGAETTLSLPSVQGEAIRAHRSKATDFWSALTGAGLAAFKQAEPETPSFAAGIDKVWLDMKAKATLADTTAQIGAPEVWAGGGTGEGVRVAILDTGVDTEHPDLAGSIAASRSFIPGEEVTDRHGHGTHTASILAGTGAASDGKERGVAPGAKLMVGKVLSDDDTGTVSGIIAGMEWAAREQHAQIVNMSLGVSAWHSQDDPLSQAVNQLTAETGALFVVAAGNDGNNLYNIGAPATADAALSVAAVDSSDHLAEFSSGGPRMNDDGLKPDISAPGVDVLAARSQYSWMGEGYYRLDSGTSMAAPHVAGAAVLLAQKHPEWTAQQLKDALMSTSKPTPDYSPYLAGTGRLDLAAAYRQDRVIATGSVDAGLVAWSDKKREPITRQISYTNVTDSPVTLDLSVDPGNSPEVFELAADQVTVPAHGTSTVDVTVKPGGLAAGQYAAQVKAVATGGAADEVHTVVGLSVESERHVLTVNVKDRAGRPVDAELEIRDAAGVSTYMWTRDGKLTSRWAPGTYAVVAIMDVEGLNGPDSLGLAIMTAPEVELTADRTVTLDASQAPQVKVDTPKPTAVTGTRIDLYRSFTSSEPKPGDYSDLNEKILLPAAYDSVWALPTGPKVKKGSFVFTTRFRAQQPPLQISYGGRHIEPLVQPGSTPGREGKQQLEAVFAGTGTQADYAGVSARGKIAVVRSSDAVSPAERGAAAYAAGAAMLLVVNDVPGRKMDWYGTPGDFMTMGPIPVATVRRDEGEALIDELTSGKKTTKLKVEGHPAPAYLYDLADRHVGAVPADPSPKTGPHDLARIDEEFTPQAGLRLVDSRTDFQPYEYYGVGVSSDQLTLAAGSRTDWVSAGDDIQWRHAVNPGDMFGATLTGQSLGEVLSYRPGSVQEDRWYGPVTRPRMISTDIPFRGQYALSAVINGFGDAGTAHSGGTNMPQRIRVYQGDKLLRDMSNNGELYVEMTPEKLPYRLVVETENDGNLGPYSTTTSTDWHFTSEGPDDPAGFLAVPLLQLDYDAGTDADGKAKRNSDFAVMPVVVGSDAAEYKPSSLKLEVSYDDGATWQQQSVKEKKGAWQTSLKAPRGAEYVSIRVTAEQRNGDGVTQTVMRAFGLK